MRNSPRCATRIRLGVSAKTPELPPKAKPVFANGLCHSRTMVYGLSPTGPVISAFGDWARIAALKASVPKTDNSTNGFNECFTGSSW